MHEAVSWNLLQILEEAREHGAVWSTSGSDLNVTLLNLGVEQAIPEHVNPEVDVVGLVLPGDGTLTVDGREAPIGAGHAFYVPRSSVRSIEAGSEGLAYISCHLRRRPLQVRPIRE